MPIAKFAVHRRVAVSMIALAIVVLGFFAFPRLAIALLPNFTQPVVTVSVTYPNVGPEQMETLITRPIENAVSRVNGIQQINSSSSEGNTQVTAQFYFGTNIDTAAVDVQEQVSRIWGTLPNDPNLKQPVITKFDSNSLPVVRMFVTDPNMTLRDLGDLFTNQLGDEFSSIDGVAAVTVGNDQQRAIMIEPSADALAVNGISLQQIMQRVGEENINLPAGIVQVGKSEYLVRASALLQSAQETGQLVVTTKNNAPIRLDQIAKVSDSILEQRTFQRLGGTPAVGITINAQPNANIVATSVGVYAKIKQLADRYPGMHFGVVFDQQGFIREAIAALEHTALYGAVLAILIILLFLHSWRSTLIVAVSLPVSILGTLFAAYVFGYSLNIMTLGGLALAVGLIVDDAIVVIENIYRHMARGQTPMEAAETATAEILSAVLASSITVITVFVPLVLIPGLQGLLFTPFAVMVMVAVGLSLVVAVTQVPMLSSVILRKRGGAGGNGAAANGDRRGAYARFSHAFDRRYERFAQWYARTLTRAVDRPVIVFSIAGAVLAITLIALAFGAVKTELFPPSNSSFARFNLQMPTGTALSVTNAVATDVENRMRKDSRVANVGASGRTEWACGRNAGYQRRQLVGHPQARRSRQSSPAFRDSVDGGTDRIALGLGRTRARLNVVHTGAAETIARQLRQADCRTSGVWPYRRHRSEHHRARTGRAPDSDLRPERRHALQSRRIYRDSEASNGNPGAAAASARHHERATRDRHQRQPGNGRATRRKHPDDFASGRYRNRRTDRIVHADQRYAVSDRSSAPT